MSHKINIMMDGGTGHLVLMIIPIDNKFEPLNKKLYDWEASIFASELMTIVVIEPLTSSISVAIDTFDCSNKVILSDLWF